MSKNRINEFERAFCEVRELAKFAFTDVEFRPFSEDEIVTDTSIQFGWYRNVSAWEVERQDVVTLEQTVGLFSRPGSPFLHEMNVLTAYWDNGGYTDIELDEGYFPVDDDYVGDEEALARIHELRTALFAVAGSVLDMRI